jgi:hypothetical protein
LLEDFSPVVKVLGFFGGHELMQIVVVMVICFGNRQNAIVGRRHIFLAWSAEQPLLIFKTNIESSSSLTKEFELLHPPNKHWRSTDLDSEKSLMILSGE